MLPVTSITYLPLSKDFRTSGLHAPSQPQVLGGIPACQQGLLAWILQAPGTWAARISLLEEETPYKQGIDAGGIKAAHGVSRSAYQRLPKEIE